MVSIKVKGSGLGYIAGLGFGELELDMILIKENQTNKQITHQAHFFFHPRKETPVLRFSHFTMVTDRI